MQLRRKYRLDRVKISSAEDFAFRNTPGIKLRDPHPEHIGKFGDLIGELYETNMPIIRLDDGTILTGGDCWWEYVTV